MLPQPLDVLPDGFQIGLRPARLICWESGKHKQVTGQEDALNPRVGSGLWADFLNYERLIVILGISSLRGDSHR